MLTVTRAAHANETKSDSTLVPCQECHFLRDCGGLDGQQQLWGCFSECKSTGLCNQYDWTCPCRPREFARRLAEVGGNLNPIASIFLTASLDNIELPFYVPVIHHGYRRRSRLRQRLVALPTFEVIRSHRGGTYGPVAKTASSLRRKFRVGNNAEVLLISPTHDQLLESYWEKRRAQNMPRSLLELQFIAMSLPNFSFFTDAPRTHTLWNRKRLMLVAREMTESGIAAIPHLNTLTNADGVFWRDILRENPAVTVVAKEFQTGATIDDLEWLARLQDSLKRPLHPLIIGGARFVRAAARHFEALTLVDSQPFMKTVKRQRLSIDPYRNAKRWIAFPTKSGEFLDELLSHNIRVYEHWVRSEIALVRPQEARQLSLRIPLPAPCCSQLSNPRRKTA